MKMVVVAGLLGVPLELTGLTFLFVANIPSLLHILIPLWNSSLVYALYCVFPVLAYSAIFRVEDISLAAKFPRTLVAVAAVIAGNLVSYFVAGTGLAFLLALLFSDVVYFGFFLTNVLRIGGIRWYTIDVRRRILLLLVLYLGTIPWVFPAVRTITTMESSYYASLLAYTFALIISSSNLVLMEPQ